MAYVALLVLPMASLYVWQRHKHLFLNPSTSGPWRKDYTVLQEAQMQGDVVHIPQMRDASYRTRDDFDVHYIPFSFRISDIESLWFVYSWFGFGAAHTFFSFGLNDGRYFTISAEVRRRPGMKFGWRVLFLPNPLTYCVATEEDAIRTRVVDRGDAVRLFRLAVSPKVARRVAQNMLTRMNELAHAPVFYDLFGGNCTSLLFDHLKSADPALPIPRWHWAYVVSSRIHVYAARWGLLRAGVLLEPSVLHKVPRHKFSQTIHSLVS